jgi:basic amino acid/polyamine antiporter, APA family
MNQLRRTISLNTAIAIVIGGVIGSGIFMKPAAMAEQLGSPMLLLSVWIVAGVITLFGALSNAEVATMFPETGGQYIFFEKMYGKFFSYLYGWAAFAVFNTAGNASIAYVCAEYANYFLHLPRVDIATEQSYHFSIPGVGKFYLLQNLGVKLLTISILLLLTFINYKSVAFGSGVVRVLTFLKVAAIAILILGLLSSGNGSFSNLNSNSAFVPSGFALLGAYMAAISGAFWAYDGWNNITFIAGEIQQPQKNIPKALFIGLLTCIFTYVLVNLALVYIMPIDKMADSFFVASDAATIAWGATGAILITLMVVLSTLGATHSNTLATARVTLAWSKENKIISAAAKVHKSNNTPGNALLLNAAWSCILIMSGSFDMLTDMLVFVSWFFYMMSGIGLLVLRRKMPNKARPYKVWGYPFIPVIFILFAAVFLLVTLYTDISNYVGGKTTFINSGFGLLITLVGVPLYFLSAKKQHKIPAVQVSTSEDVI